MLPKHFLQSHSLPSSTTDKMQRKDLCVSSDTYLNPKTLIAVKQKRAMKMFTKTETLKKNKIIKKYFGRKVAYVTSRSDIPHAKSHFRFIRNFNLDQGYGHEQNSCTLTAFNFRSLGDRVLWDNNIQVKNPTDSKRLISNCNRLIIETYDHFLLTTFKLTWRFNKNVKHLSLSLWANNTQFTSQLNLLLPKILRDRSLISFNLCLGRDVTYNVLTELLLSLDKAEVQRWYMKAELMESELNDVTAIVPVLEKIDLLGLEAMVYNVEEYTDTAGFLSEMTDLTAKRKRVLDLTLKTYAQENRENVEDKIFENYEMVSLDMILKHCRSLEGLYIKSVWNMLDWKIDIPRIINTREEQEERQNREEAKRPLANLKDLVLIVDDLQADYYPSSSLEKFLGLIKSPLRSLNLFNCVTYKEYKRETESYRENREVYTGLFHHVFIPRLNFYNIGSLEELTFYYSGDCSNLQRNLESLSNLKKFTLHLCPLSSEASICWDQNFPFENLAHLTEFHLTIHSYAKMLPWGETLTQNIPILSKLQVLEIIDETRQRMELHVFYDLIKGLARFEKLQKLRIKTKIKRELTIAMVFLIGEEDIKKKERKVFEDIKAMIRRLIYVNPMLEELEISEIEGYDISRIVYNRMMIKDNIGI